MATNKNKDSAALFELLDKSTLKVPKSGGPLKVPSWWSSKTNPTVPAEASAGANGAPKAVGGGVEAGGGANGVVRPVAAAPGGSPSIRPPVKAVAVAEAVKKGATSNDWAVGRKMYPQTVDPRTVKKSGAGGSGRGVPMGVWIGGGVVVVLILLLVVIVPWGGKPGKVGPAVTGGGLPGPVQLPPSISVPGRNDSRQVGPVVPVAPRVDVVRVETSHVGRVLAAGEVNRVAGNYYAVMVSTKNESLAQKNAEFIAGHGVDVWIKAQPTGFFSVVSAESFGKLDDPARDAMAKKIVEISHQHPDFVHKQRGPYDRAYFTKTP